MLMGELGFKLVQNDCGLRGALEVWRQVFVKEQGIAEALVFDGDDADTLHAVVSDGMKVIGAARVRFPGAGRAKLERMAVLEGWRRAGVGRRFTAFLIGELRGTGVEEVVLHAQCAAVPFYRSCGFEEVGSPFQEAGVEHIEMRRLL